MTDDDQGSSLRELPLDRYADFRPAGEGGMGIVYWAIDTDLNREVAFKVIRSRTGEEDAATPAAPVELRVPEEGTPASRTFRNLRQRFLQEAWVTGGLSHPGIVPVYELGQTPEGVPYYTMRFVRGERTLEDAIEETKDGEGSDRLKLLEPFLKVCDTIRYAHAQGVIHRDLKPENVALGEYGEVVVLDWGMAKVQDRPDIAAGTWHDRVQEFRNAGNLKTVASALGTPGYMSPEAALGQVENVDERSDVYSLGAVLFKLLTGDLPFAFETFLDLVQKLRKEPPPDAAARNPAVPPALARVCARALAREPNERFSSAGEIAETIRTWQQESADRQEVRALLKEADAALEGAEGLEGDALLRQLDRVTALCARVHELRPTHQRTQMLLETVEKTRARAIREREHAVRQREREARRRTLWRVAAGVAIAAALGVAAAAWLLDVERRDVWKAEARAEDAERRTKESRDILEREVARVADVRAHTDAEREARSLAEAKLRAEQAATRRAVAEADAQRTAVREARAEIESERSARERIETEAKAARKEAAEAKAAREEEKTLHEEALRRLRAEYDARLTGIGRVRAWALAQSSRSVLGRDPQLGLLLAREAVRVTPISPLFEHLRRALRRAAPVDPFLLTTHDDRVVCAVFSPDGERVLSASLDGKARLTSLEGARRGIEFGHASDLTHAILSPNGKLILTTSYDDAPILWSRNGRKQASLRGWGTGTFEAAAFASDASRLVTGSSNGRAHVWDPKGNLLFSLAPHSSSLVEVGISANGKRILTAFEDGTLRLWDAKGNLVRHLDAHRSRLTRAAFSPDGNYVLTGSNDGTARLSSFGGGRGAALRGHTGAVRDVSFSPDGTLALTASEDGTARLWGRRRGTPAVLRGHEMAVLTARFSPDGTQVVTASRDRTACIWDLEGDLLDVLSGHEAAVTSAVFSPDGQRVVTASVDGTVRLWLVRADDLLRLADAHLTRDFTAEERARYADLLPPEEDR